ncbi:MAG TPA: tRNA lysidine(34) synthetase TilS [Candidatus Azoamicus sp.]
MFIFNKKNCDVFSKFKFHRNIYIAYSGGVDSSVLLHLVTKFFSRDKFFLKVMHVNHGYSCLSHMWSIFCKNVCDEYKIPICIFNSGYFKKKKNLEEEFRFIRFNFFFNFILKNSTLLLAHNNDDFLETIFLRLFRGSNFFSVFGIQYANKIGKLNILRPLMDVSKDDIKKFALLNNIRYINDVSNFDVKFIRNYIRSKILPVVIFEWPNFDKVIFRSFFLSNNFYVYFYFRYFLFFRSNGFNLERLNIKYLFLLPYFMRCEVIKLWIKANNFKTPSCAQFKELDKLLYSKDDSFGFIFIKDYFLKKNKNYLCIENNFIEKTYSNIFVYLKKNNLIYFYFEHVLFLNFKFSFIKNFILVKYINCKFFVLGLYYHDKFLKEYFIFKVLY